MTVAPIFATSPPARSGWRPSLVGAAREFGTYEPPDSDVARRLGGISYQPPSDNTWVRTFDPCDSPELVHSQGDPAAVWLPWGITARDDCPSIGNDPVAAAGRVTATLRNQTSHLIEEVLWTGLLDVGTDIETMAAANSPAGSNRRLASDSATLIDGTAAHGFVDAFGHILDWVPTVLGGENAWIHLEPRLLPYLAFYNLATRTSARAISTVLGDYPIVAGTGYTGSGPAAQVTGTGQSWIYVTTPVRVIEGPIFEPGDPEAFLDRSLNRFRPVASRMVLADWDLEVHGAIRVATPDPGPTWAATGS